MKLFLYDHFMDSLLKLNRTTQQRVTDFMNKFRQDSTSAAIHLKPISTFIDPTLRTARIDRKYRAILKEVDPGKTYLLLWVDNHDEAMDWAKNKIIDWNENTQAYQVFTMDESVQRTTSVDTDPEELFYNRYGEKDLLRLGVPEMLLPSVLKIKDLNDLDQMLHYLPEDVFENLFYLMDGASLDALITEVNEGTTRAREMEEQMYSPNNRRSFIEVTDDRILEEALSGSLKKWKYFLHPSQAQYVEKNFRGAMKLSGGAGTGKTVVALHRLKYLSTNRRSDHPILMTTYTKELTQNLQALAADLGVHHSTYEINNIDSLAFRLATERNIISSKIRIFEFNQVQDPIELWEKVLETQLSRFDEEFLRAEYEQVILEQGVHDLATYLRTSRIGRGRPIGRRDRMDIWKLIEEFNRIKSAENLMYKEEVYHQVADYLIRESEVVFSHVIVDELQDFSNVELRFLRSLTPEGENDLFMVGDPFQNIYGKQITFSRAGINIRGRRSRRLRINYRTTEEIRQLAVSVLRDERFDDFEGGEEDQAGYLSLFHGLNPEYRVFSFKNEEANNVVNEIQLRVQEGYQFSEIAVASRTRQGFREIRDLLHEQGIPFVSRNLLDQNQDGVRLTTFHGMKGLEFRHVFLVDVNDRTLPWRPHDFDGYSSEEQSILIRQEKALFYVACSRAVERLIVTGTGNKSDLVEI